jgi:hypothetical protein
MRGGQQRGLMFLPVQNPSAENFEIEINAILDGER